MFQLLQKECDQQSRKILEYFRKNRDFDVKLQRVQQANMQPKNSIFEKSVSICHLTIPFHPAYFIFRINANELDRILSECTLLNTRSELYLRFVKRRILVGIVFLYR
jgi:hypothetical protein